MDSIKLTDGIVAIGAAHHDLTSGFSRKLANHLAKSEKVLYITYLTYKELIQTEILRMDGKVESNLVVDDELTYFNVATFLSLIKQIEKNNFTTIVLEDIEDFVSDELESYYEDCKRNESILEAFVFLAEKYNVRILFTMLVRSLSSKRPTLSDFRWSRKILSSCSQVFAIHRESYHGIMENEFGISTVDDIEVLSLKNADCHNETILLDNKKVKIY